MTQKNLTRAVRRKQTILFFWPNPFETQEPPWTRGTHAIQIKALMDHSITIWLSGFSLALLVQESKESASWYALQQDFLSWQTLIFIFFISAADTTSNIHLSLRFYQCGYRERVSSAAGIYLLLLVAAPLRRAEASDFWLHTTATASHLRSNTRRGSSLSLTQMDIVSGQNSR